MKEYIVRVYDDRTGWLNKSMQYHREDGPALEYKNGKKLWFIDGSWHREDGPAVEYPDGTKYWYLNDKPYSEEQYNAKMNTAPTCAGKVVEIDGKKFKLVEVKE